MIDMKKKTKEKQAPAKEPSEAREMQETASAPESSPLQSGEKEPEPAARKPSPDSEKAKSGQKEDQGGPLRIFAIVVLFAALIFLAYYFLVASGTTFATGQEINVDAFKSEFLNASKVFIVMDIRGIGSDAISDNVIQCGVDFAGSSGMGGKSMTYISIDESECVASDGNHPVKDCFDMLKNGLTIYVKGSSGPEGGAKYYTNGMVVTVGSNYTLGTCGIKLV